MLNEAWDDFLRYLRDKDINEKVYAKLTENGELVDILSENIKVGDIIKVKQNERIPADMVLLYTTEHENANVFIRTDQLDGETDWKLRKSVGYTQIQYQQHHQLCNLEFLHKNDFIIKIFKSFQLTLLVETYIFKKIC